ncbi:MAG: hypothetical protein NHG00_00835 [Candidatus Shikimatogenerans sp. JK-2022]|nr:hypothetical protein [Candidatus Shikimatogenerans bostrichidophilus]
MTKKEIKKILKIRKLTNFSFFLCKESLKINNWDIKKSINYLRIKEGNKNINLNNLKFGIAYSYLNKSKTLGHIIELKVNNKEVANNKKLLKILKKIIKISILNKCKKINDLYKLKFSKNKDIYTLLLDYSIMFKDSIKINKFKILKTNYIYNYNHYNNQIASLIGYKIKINNFKKLKKIIKYISLDLISNFLNKKKEIKKINNYYKSDKIDPLLLKRIGINKVRYLYYLNKYINIYDYYIIYI